MTVTVQWALQPSCPFASFQTVLSLWTKCSIKLSVVCFARLRGQASVTYVVCNDGVASCC